MHAGVGHALLVSLFRDQYMLCYTYLDLESNYVAL